MALRFRFIVGLLRDQFIPTAGFGRDSRKFLRLVVGNVSDGCIDSRSVHLHQLHLAHSRETIRRSFGEQPPIGPIRVKFMVRHRDPLRPPHRGFQPFVLIGAVQVLDINCRHFALNFTFPLKRLQ